MTACMTRQELRQLVEGFATTDVETAGRAYGIGRRNSYELARRCEFPVEVLKIGTRYRVRTALLAADLLQDETAPDSSIESGSKDNDRPARGNRSHDQ